MEELHCRFLEVTVGDEVAAAGGGSLAGGEGLAGGESNGSRGGRGLSVVIFGEGMNL